MHIGSGILVRAVAEALGEARGLVLSDAVGSGHVGRSAVGVQPTGRRLGKAEGAVDVGVVAYAQTGAPRQGRTGKRQRKAALHQGVVAVEHPAAGCAGAFAVEAAEADEVVRVLGRAGHRQLGGALVGLGGIGVDALDDLGHVAGHHVGGVHAGVTAIAVVGMGQIAVAHGIEARVFRRAHRQRVTLKLGHAVVHGRAIGGVIQLLLGERDGRADGIGVVGLLRRHVQAGLLHRDVVIGEEVEARHLRGDEAAHVLVHIGRLIALERLGLGHGDHVQLEHIEPVGGDARDHVGRAGVIAVGRGFNAHHVAVLGGCHVLQGAVLVHLVRIGGHLLVGIGDLEVLLLPFLGHVRIHVGADRAALAAIGGIGTRLIEARGVHALGVGHLPIAHGNLAGAGRRVGVVGRKRRLAVGSHAVGQHNRHHGQQEVALRAAINSVGVLGGGIGRRVVVDRRLVGHGPLQRLALQPVAVLDEHVQLARLGLGIHVVVGLLRRLHRRGDARTGLELAHRGPRAQHRRALHGMGARLGVEALAALVAGVPVNRAVVGHLQAHGRQRLGRASRLGADDGRIGHDGVVEHRVPVHGGHVGRAVAEQVAGAGGAGVAAQGVGVIHAVGLHVLATTGVGSAALVQIGIVNGVVAGRHGRLGGVLEHLDVVADAGIDRARLLGAVGDAHADGELDVNARIGLGALGGLGRRRLANGDDMPRLMALHLVVLYMMGRLKVGKHHHIAGILERLAHHVGLSVAREEAGEVDGGTAGAHGDGHSVGVEVRHGDVHDGAGGHSVVVRLDHRDGKALVGERRLGLVGSKPQVGLEVGAGAHGDLHVGLHGVALGRRARGSHRHDSALGHHEARHGGARDLEAARLERRLRIVGRHRQIGREIDTRAVDDFHVAGQRIGLVIRRVHLGDGHNDALGDGIAGHAAAQHLVAIVGKTGSGGIHGHGQIALERLGRLGQGLVTLSGGLGGQRSRSRGGGIGGLGAARGAGDARHRVVDAHAVGGSDRHDGGRRLAIAAVGSARGGRDGGQNAVLVVLLVAGGGQHGSHGRNHAAFGEVFGLARARSALDRVHDGRVIPRSHEHAVVPGAVLVVAEHMAAHVHAQLVAARRVGLDILVRHVVGVGGIGGGVVDGAPVPLAQVLLHRDLEHPRLRALDVALALHEALVDGRRALAAAHGQVGGTGHVSGQIGEVGLRAIARAVAGRILRGARRIVAGVGRIRRLEHLYLYLGRIKGEVSFHDARRVLLACSGSGVVGQAVGVAVGRTEQLGRKRHGAVLGNDRLHAARHDVGELHAVQVAVAVVVSRQASRELVVVLQRRLVLAVLDAAIGGRAVHRGLGRGEVARQVPLLVRILGVVATCRLVIGAVGHKGARAGKPGLLQVHAGLGPHERRGRERGARKRAFLGNKLAGAGRRHAGLFNARTGDELEVVALASAAEAHRGVGVAVGTGAAQGVGRRRRTAVHHVGDLLHVVGGLHVLVHEDVVGPMAVGAVVGGAAGDVGKRVAQEAPVVHMLRLIGGKRALVHEGVHVEQGVLGLDAVHAGGHGGRGVGGGVGRRVEQRQAAVVRGVHGEVVLAEARQVGRLQTGGVRRALGRLGRAGGLVQIEHHLRQVLGSGTYGEPDLQRIAHLHAGRGVIGPIGRAQKRHVGGIVLGAFHAVGAEAVRIHRAGGQLALGANKALERIIQRRGRRARSAHRVVLVVDPLDLEGGEVGRARHRRRLAGLRKTGGTRIEVGEGLTSHVAGHVGQAIGRDVVHGAAEVGGLGSIHLSHLQTQAVRSLGGHVVAGNVGPAHVAHQRLLEVGRRNGLPVGTAQVGALKARGLGGGQQVGGGDALVEHGVVQLALAGAGLGGARHHDGIGVGVAVGADLIRCQGGISAHGDVAKLRDVGAGVNASVLMVVERDGVVARLELSRVRAPHAVMAAPASRLPAGIVRAVGAREVHREVVEGVALGIVPVVEGERRGGVHREGGRHRGIRAVDVVIARRVLVGALIMRPGIAAGGKGVLRLAGRKRQARVAQGVLVPEHLAGHVAELLLRIVGIGRAGQVLALEHLGLVGGVGHLAVDANGLLLGKAGVGGVPLALLRAPRHHAGRLVGGLGRSI